MDTPDTFVHSVHAISIVSFPVQLFTIYCILFETPKAMNSVKWVLLNARIWTVILDLSLTVFTIPFVIFPALAGTPLGILTEWFEVPTSFQTYFVFTNFFSRLNFKILAKFGNFSCNG